MARKASLLDRRDFSRRQGTRSRMSHSLQLRKRCRLGRPAAPVRANVFRPPESLARVFTHVDHGGPHSCQALDLAREIAYPFAAKRR